MAVGRWAKPPQAERRNVEQPRVEVEDRLLWNMHHFQAFKGLGTGHWWQSKRLTDRQIRGNPHGSSSAWQSLMVYHGRLRSHALGETYYASLVEAFWLVSSQRATVRN